MTKPRKRKDYIPVTVPFAATQTGETPGIPAWAHSAVWTDRMLDTLNVGVRGGKWHTLIDKVFDKRNLYASARKVLGKKGAAGVDHQSVEDFSADALTELARLHEQLRDDLYRPLAVRRTWIPKLGSNEQRPLGIPTVRDRVVQTAVVHVIEPIFDHTFHKHSYGFRRGRGCHQALTRVEELLAAGNVFVVDADLKSYFDTIPKDRLMEMVASKVSDRRILKLIEMYLEQEIMEDLKSWTPEAGVPQGAVLSPLLSNVYHSVPYCRRGRAGIGSYPPVGLFSRPDAAPREDAYRRLSRRELRLSRLFVSRQASVSARQEQRQRTRCDSLFDASQVRPIAGCNHPVSQSKPARLACILPTLSLEHISRV